MASEANSAAKDAEGKKVERSILPDTSTTSGRIGCGVLLVVWVIVLLIPFGLFWLAVGNSIAIYRTNAPDRILYPRAELSLQMEIENRGFRWRTSRIFRPDDTNLYIQTNIRFLLWERGDDLEINTTYCDHFTRETPEADWQRTSTFSDTTCRDVIDGGNT